MYLSKLFFSGTRDTTRFKIILLVLYDDQNRMPRDYAKMPNEIPTFWLWMNR